MARKTAAKARTTAAQTRTSRWLYPLRVARSHIRLSVTALIGVPLLLLLPQSWAMTTRLLVAWNGGIAFYLALVAVMLARFDEQRVRRRAAEVDEGAVLILLLVAGAAVASLGAIVGEMGAMSALAASERTGYIALAALTIVQSWALIQTIFALHYAHDYYGDHGDGFGGLIFPQDEAPDYWDFVYFSFVIGMTFQVSDVQVTSKRMRRVVVAHGALAFFFNLAILALAVNIASSVLTTK